MRARLSAMLALPMALAGCQALDPSSNPRTIPTGDGGSVSAITCQSNILAIGERGCRRNALSKCKPGAEIVRTDTSSRPVYTPHGYMSGTVWTYLIKGCTS